MARSRFSMGMYSTEAQSRPVMEAINKRLDADGDRDGSKAGDSEDDDNKLKQGDVTAKTPESMKKTQKEGEKEKKALLKKQAERAKNLKNKGLSDA